MLLFKQYTAHQLSGEVIEKQYKIHRGQGKRAYMHGIYAAYSGDIRLHGVVERRS